MKIVLIYIVTRIQTYCVCLMVKCPKTADDCCSYNSDYVLVRFYTIEVKLILVVYFQIV
jgi:hypothetical protein